MGPRDRTHLTPQRLRRRLPHPHSVTWLSGQPDLRHPRQAGVDHLGRTRRGLGSRKCCLCVRRPPRQDEAGATAVRGGPGFSPTGSRHFAKTPGWWRWRESNPRPPAHYQGFSERSPLCLCSAPPIMQTSRCDGPSRCAMSRARPRPARAVSHLADARNRVDDEPGLTDHAYAAIRQRGRTRADQSRRLCVLQRMVNELIVAFLGSLPLASRPKSRPITPCAVVQTA